MTAHQAAIAERCHVFENKMYNKLNRMNKATKFK